MTDQAKRSATTRYSTRILRSHEEIRGVAEACARCRHNQKRPQADLGFEFAPSPDAKYRLVLLCDGDEIVGYAGVKVGVWRYPWRIPMPGRSLVVARIPLLSADYRDNDLIAPDDDEARRLLLRVLLDACADCSVIRVWFVAEDSDLWRLVRESRALRSGRWILLSWLPTPHWSARLAGSMEEYLRKFGPKTRTKLRRRLRMLAEIAGGEVELHVTTSREDVPAFLQRAMDIGAKSARPGAIRGEMGDAENARLLERLAEAGRLRCYTLTAAGKPVGFMAGWMTGDTYCMYRTGFDREWASCSPGTTLVLLLIEDLHRLPEARVVDFGHGHWDYKQFFSSDSFTELGVFLVRPGVKSAITFVPVLFSQAVKGVAKAVLRTRQSEGDGGRGFRRGSQSGPAAFIGSIRARHGRS
jgi:hypothetical protein